MVIEIDVTPEDLANLMIDNAYHPLYAKGLIDKIIAKVQEEVDVQTDVLDEIDYLVSEYLKSEKEFTENLLKEAEKNEKELSEKDND